ncbi:hypothetical protein LE181_22740 [Streptomyces sp. SCA3-4]|uniref:hypothetical protein n=1 Tax=Streptomyces sichuanensis TaxID=2871810 RepID=UPI001CE2AAF8|nr:hypothetical protein [Streptomyces sichuanensis]MCA6094977.1 hypothetical protein [Streptomyces sichuanensis]
MTIANVTGANTTGSRRPDRAGVWLGILLRQFPELGRELAPSRTARPALAPGGRGSRTAPAAPIRLFISDTVRDITDGVVELEEAVCDKLRLPRPPRGTVEARLTRLIAALDRISGDPDLAEHVRAEARRMARRCSLALGDAETPVRVRGRCPHCDSVSLRVFPHRETVLCVNPGCCCEDPACACRTDARHRHAWVRSEWRRLAEATDGDLTEMAAAQDEAAQDEEMPR